jgi:hypothetical protein
MGAPQSGQMDEERGSVMVLVFSLPQKRTGKNVTGFF